MKFSPKVLLSNAVKERCIVNLREIPAFVQDLKQKVNTSVLVPLCVDNGEVCLLYTTRSMRLKSHSGQIAFPGGKMENDETVFETALRETEEEVGFPCEDVDIWEKMREVQGRSKSVVIVPVVGYLKNFSMDRLTANVDEVAEMFTVPIRTLCDPANHGHLLYENIITPVFFDGKHKIWGITGMITHLFLQSLLPTNVYDFDFLQKGFELDELMPSKL